MMNGQFKTENFDKKYFKEFAAELEQVGIPITITWKKNNKKVEETNKKANVFQLETDGKWFFRIIKDKGHVRFKNLNPEQEKTVLALLKKYHFYNDPNWGLGIGLIVLYLIIEFFISSAQQISWLMPAIMVCCLFVIVFLCIAYQRATEKISDSAYKACMFFGIPAYIFTAIGSLLALPLFISISRYHLKYKIFKTE